MLNKKEKNRIKSRKWKRRDRKTGVDGSSINREMAGARVAMLYRKIREERDDPYTKHPLSFEEFDDIPDIGNLIIKEKEGANNESK